MHACMCLFPNVMDTGERSSLLGSVSNFSRQFQYTQNRFTTMPVLHEHRTKFINLDYRYFGRCPLSIISKTKNTRFENWTCRRPQM